MSIANTAMLRFSRCAMAQSRFKQFLQVGQREQARQPVVADGHRGGLMRAAQRIAGQLWIDAQPVAGIAMVPAKCVIRPSASRSGSTVSSFQNSVPSLR